VIDSELTRKELDLGIKTARDLSAETFLHFTDPREKSPR